MESVNGRDDARLGPLRFRYSATKVSPLFITAKATLPTKWYAPGSCGERLQGREAWASDFITTEIRNGEISSQPLLVIAGVA
jgi:hypothetical protein